MHLRPIEHRNQRILTTQQIAEAYGADSQIVTNNFNRNKKRYTEGKHYFLLEGESLEAFKASLEIADHLEGTTNQFDLSSNLVNNTRLNKLYLWTEKGALMHAKSLNTDKAWEAYEELVDDYYRRGDQLLTMLEISERLTELEKRLHSLPLGLSDAQIDIASMATTRIYQSLTRNLSLLSTYLGNNKITSKQFQEVIQTVKELVEPMSELRSVIDQELALEKDLTFILFDYRGVLKTLAPGYQLMSSDTPKLIEAPEK